MANSRSFNGDGVVDHRGLRKSRANPFGENFTDRMNRSDPGSAMDLFGGDLIGLTEANANGGHPLLEIPEDIWPQILQSLTQYEVVRSRLVCKKLQGIVDKVIDFNVTVDERKCSLQRLSQLHIRKCRIWRLDSPDQFVPEQPMLLRSLELPGLINPAAFQRIVDCATELEHLEMDLDGLVVGGRVPEELRGTLNGLSNLRTLEITDYERNKEAPAITAENLSRILAHQMPFLENFRFDRLVCQDPSPLIQHELVQFLSRSPALQKVRLWLAGEDHPAGSEEALPDRERVIFLPPLHTLDISCETQFLPICAPLLNASTRLKNLKVFDAGRNLGLPSQILSGPLLRNAASLVEVELDGVRLSTSAERQPGQAPTPLDAGVFRDASNLRKLILYRKEEDWELFPDELPEQPNLINFWMLPSTLEVLKIDRFTVRTDEMERVMPGLDKMKKVRMTGTGKGDGLGVHRELASFIVFELRIKKYILEPVENFDLSPEGVGGRVETGKPLRDLGFKRRIKRFQRRHVPQ